MIEKTDHHASFRGRRLAHFPSPSIHASGENWERRGGAVLAAAAVGGEFAAKKFIRGCASSIPP